MCGWKGESLDKSEWGRGRGWGLERVRGGLGFGVVGRSRRVHSLPDVEGRLEGRVPGHVRVGSGLGVRKGLGLGLGLGFGVVGRSGRVHWFPDVEGPSPGTLKGCAAGRASPLGRCGCELKLGFEGHGSEVDPQSEIELELGSDSQASLCIIDGSMRPNGRRRSTPGVASHR